MAKTLGASTAYVTAPDSFASLKRYVVDYVQGGDDPDLLDVAGRAINRAIDSINMRHWQKLVGIQTIATTLNVTDYSLNNDVSAPRSLALLDSSDAPTASVSPERARPRPNKSLASELEALMYACCDHVPSVRVNTYTAPLSSRLLSSWSPPIPVALLSSPLATANVSPERATR